MSQVSKALEILKLAKWHIQSHLVSSTQIDEAIAELEKYEQKSKQDEDKPDRLAELEKVILEQYLAKGYQVGDDDWGFEVNTRSKYEFKILTVTFWDNENDYYNIIYNSEPNLTTKEMWDKAINHFSINKEVGV